MDVTRPFEAEIARLRAANVAGESGRVRDIFDWLAARGPGADSATQEEIAREVFGQDQTDADDATVRVYVHRLRKKIDDFYIAHGLGEGGTRLDIPPGVYALRLDRRQPDEDAPAPPVAPAPAPAGGVRRWRSALVGGLFIALVAALLASLWQRPAAPNAIWQPIARSDRPVLLVLGDYYLYGEIDPVRPELSRLIRDFRVDSASDLYALQEAEPDRYGAGEDVGLNYLPFSSAYGILHILPLLTDAGEEVTVIAASQLEPDMLNYFDVVYVGLLSGMHVLEEQAFRGTSFAIGASYDELTDRETGETYVSSEARSLSSPAFYEDYAYVARFTAATGAQVVVLASQRETGLRGLSPVVTGDELPSQLADAAQAGAFEALFQVTGQQGADLAQTLLLARPRE